MKVSLNQIPKINNISALNYRHSSIANKISEDNNKESFPAGLTISNFYPVSFGKLRLNPDMEFLLGYANYFKCAYTGRPMISKPKAKEIYQKLEKRQNAQASINLLQHTQRYMHDVESIVFNILSDAPYLNKRDFQDILNEFVPDSLEQLKIKQFEILNNTNKLISTLSEPIAKQVITIRDETLLQIEDGTFGRKKPLNKIKSINATGKDLQQVIKIYRKWYKLPTSSNDLDAFIVQYSKMPHLAIAKRLISSAVASLEHVKPHSRGGDDGLANLILVSSQFNNARDTMPLWEFMMLNPKINFEVNLQNYLDLAIKKVQDSKNGFFEHSYYPECIKEVIAQETNSFVQLDTGSLSLTKKQIKDRERLQKLCSMYKMFDE